MLSTRSTAEAAVVWGGEEAPAREGQHMGVQGSLQAIPA